MMQVLEARSGEEVQFFSLMSRFTLDSIGEIGFGQNIDSLSTYPEYHPFLQSFDRAQAITFERMRHPLWFIDKIMQIRDERELTKHVAKLRELGLRVVKDTRSKFETAGPQGDFLSLFLAKTKQMNAEVCDNFLCDICLNFLIAGRDTTAAALSWIMVELNQNPEVLAKARAEIADVRFLTFLVPV
jgi:cytochrome P450